MKGIRYEANISGVVALTSAPRSKMGRQVVSMHLKPVQLGNNLVEFVIVRD